MSTLRRVVVIPAAVVALAACSGDDGALVEAPTSTAAVTTPAVTTDDRPVAGDAREIIVQVGVDDAATLGSRVEQVTAGTDVVLRLLSESDEDYHLHGYDLSKRVAAGVEAVIRFTADEVGRFDLESHTSEQVLLVLDVV